MLTVFILKHMHHSLDKLCSIFLICHYYLQVGCQPIFNMATPGGVVVVGKEHRADTYQTVPPRFTYKQIPILNSKRTYVTSVSAKVLLTHKYQSYLVTTFLPCSMLLLLGCCTVWFFKHENFTDRITVTLSLLIVVASIFSQVVSSLPSSADVKFIDLFFFYCFFRLSSTFLQHSINDNVLRREREKEDTRAKQNTKMSSVMAWADEAGKLGAAAGDQNKQTTPFTVELKNQSRCKLSHWISCLLSAMDLIFLLLFIIIVEYNNNCMYDIFMTYNLSMHPNTGAGGAWQ